MKRRNDDVGRERQRLKLGLERGRQDLDVIRILEIGRQDSDRRLPALPHQVPVNLVAHRRRGRRRILRIERHDQDTIAAPGGQNFEPRLDRWIGVAHRPVDDDMFAERFEDAGELFGLRARDRLERRFVLVVVPDFLVVARFAPRADRQNETVEKEFPEQRVIFDDAPVAEELLKIAAHRGRRRRVGSAEIDEEHADAAGSLYGFCGGSRVCHGCLIGRRLWLERLGERSRRRQRRRGRS